MRTPHLNDWGTPFTLTIYDSSGCVLDISSASPIEMLFITPSGSTLTKEAVFSTDGTDGKLKYTSVEGDLIETGEWKYCGRVTFINGMWTTDLSGFVVQANE